MNREPRNLPLNDDTDYGLCFACGPRHPSGLRLRFERKGNLVTTTFKSSTQHQGFPGYLHGGITSTLLDEVMSRVSLLDGRWSMTARMDVRFRRPIFADQTVTAIAEKAGQSRRFVEAKGRVVLPDGTVAAEATGTYALMDAETLRGMSEGYPQLAREWMAV